MATTSIVAEDTIFQDAVKEYLEIKDLQKQLNKRLDELLATFEEYADIDKTSSFEGKQNLSCGDTTVVLEYKINRSIDKDALRELCAKTGKQPTAFVKVEYKYPSKTFISDIHPKYREEMEKCFTTSRAKTSVSIVTK